MKKIIILLLLVFSVFFIISCGNNEPIPEPIKEDNKENISDKQTDTNLDNNDNPEIIETKIISDFTVLENIDLLINETKEIEIEYDNTIEVEFKLTQDSDLLTIDGLRITSVNVGSCKLTVTEEKSGLSKDILVTITPIKNKYIDFYNGYYIYKECIKNNSPMNLWQYNDLCVENFYFELNDNYIICKNTTDNLSVYLDYDELYDLYIDSECLDYKLAVSGESLYLCFTQPQSNINKDYKICQIWCLEYNYSKPVEKEIVINSSLNIPNGYYLYDKCLFYVINRNFDEQEITASRIGNIVIDVNDSFEYREVTLLDFNSENIEKIKNKITELGFNNILDIDKAKIYKVYYQDEYIDELILLEKDHVFLAFTTYQDNLQIDYINDLTEIKYMPELIKEEEKYDDISAIVGNYVYINKVISGDNTDERLFETNIVSVLALSIKEEDLYLKNNNVSFYKRFINNLSDNTEIYDLISDSYIVQSIIIDGEKTYYARRKKNDLYFNKKSDFDYSILDVWEVAKVNKEIVLDYNNNLNIYNGTYCNYESRLLLTVNDIKYFENFIVINNESNLEKELLTNLFSKATIDVKLKNIYNYRYHLTNITFENEMVKIDDTNYILKDVDGNLYHLECKIGFDNKYYAYRIVELKRVDYLR